MVKTIPKKAKKKTIEVITQEQRYECEICGETFYYKDDAIKCEKQGEPKKVACWALNYETVNDWAIGTKGIYGKDGYHTLCEIVSEKTIRHEVYPIFDIEAEQWVDYCLSDNDYELVLILTEKTKQKIIEWADGDV